MRFRRWSQPALIVAFLAVSLLLVHHSEGAGKERLRELDVVVTTNVETKVFVSACLQGTAGRTESALSSLSPLTSRDGKSKDGAARYRLLIEHKGTVTVGGTLKATSSFSKNKQETVKKGNGVFVRIIPDLSHYETYWYLPAKQKATLTFTLLKWENDVYKTVDKWTIPAVDGEGFSETPGFSPVAHLIQDGTKMKIKPNPECPITLEQARDAAYQHCASGPFEDAFAARWVKGKFGKLTQKGDEVEYEVFAENKSPWPVSQIFVESITKNKELSSFVTFNPPIAPGKMGKSKGSCFVSELAPKKTPALRVTTATFDVEK